MRRLPPPPPKKGQNHYQRMGKKLQRTVDLRTGGSPLVDVFKVPRAQQLHPRKAVTDSWRTLK